MPHLEMKRQLRELIELLRATGRYKALVEKLESADWPPRSFIFEAIFASKFEAANHALRYEASVNKSSTESMDFVYPATGAPRVCFELVSPRVSDAVRLASGPHPTTIPGLDVEETFLHSADPDEHLRPEAQTIRLQEKILEKVGKLPEPDDAIFGLLVVDCTDIHSGMFDEEDCRMLIFGQTRLPQYQEYWRGNRIHC